MSDTRSDALALEVNQGRSGLAYQRVGHSARTALAGLGYFRRKAGTLGYTDVTMFVRDAETGGLHWEAQSHAA